MKENQAPPQYTTAQLAMIEWWLLRFVQTATARNHIRRLNRIRDAYPRAQAISRMSPYHVIFRGLGKTQVLTESGTPAASWAHGVIELREDNADFYCRWTPYYVPRLDDIMEIELA